jgi:hypothetical protein
MSTTKRPLLFATLACLVTLGTAACGSTSSDESAEVGGESALSEESNRLVLSVANSVDEDTLDLEVGLESKTARKIVEKRPFKDIDKLKEVTSKDDIKKLLAYGQAHGANGTNGANGANGANGKPGTTAPENVGPVIGLGCKDLFRVEKAALEIEWFPPKALYFEANKNNKQYYENVPFTPAVTDTGLELEASYADDEQPEKRHTAKLVLDRKSTNGTFTLDGEVFQIHCYYAETSKWEIGGK